MISIDEIQLVRHGYIGRQPSDWHKGKDHIFVDIALRPRAGVTTINHESVDEFLSLGIMGTVWRTRHRTNEDCESAGQIVDHIDPATIVPADGLRLGDIERLCEIWRRWHLNDMRANCAHQAHVWPLPKDLATIPVCPETGYKYGTAWLVEPLPAEVEAWVREFAAKLDK